MYNFDLFNWRLTNPGLATTAPVADYLDLVSGLLQDDVGYYRNALPTCDVFDVVNMLDWLRERGLVSGDADLAVWQQARDVVSGSRNVYMTKAEVESRLAHADGHCPFCGSRPSFSSEANDKGYFHCSSRCSHFRFDLVQDIEGCLRHAKAWSGKRWPYSWDRQIAREDGTPLVDEISHHCTDCRTADAHRIFKAKVVGVLREMATNALQPDWQERGGGYALSGLRCGFCQDGLEHTGQPCKHQEATLARWAGDIVTEKNGEFRLNGAGLKLYTRGIHVGFMRGEITFNMRVGGDQAAYYGRFVEWANTRLGELKLTEDSLAAA
jgi:hypothetical protein